MKFEYLDLDLLIPKYIFD